MSINQTSPNDSTNEEKAIYQSMPRVTRVAAISVIFAVLIAVTFGIDWLWQTNQFLPSSSAGEEIHMIAASPAEIWQSLRLGEQVATSATTTLVPPSSIHLLVLDSGDLANTPADILPTGVATELPLDSSASNQGLFALVDGQFVPVEGPVALQSGNSALLYIRWPAPVAEPAGEDGFELESVEHSHVAATPNISATHAIPLADTRVDGPAGQNFTLSLTSTKESRSITIIMWNNY